MGNWRVSLEIKISVKFFDTDEETNRMIDRLIALREGKPTGAVGKGEGEFIRKQGVSATGPCAECAQYFEMQHDGSGTIVPMPLLHPQCVCQDIPVAMLAIAGEDFRPAQRFEYLETKASKAELLKIAGPTRAGLIEAGKLGVKDLYAKQTGKPKRLRNLRLRGRKVSRERRRELFNKARRGERIQTQMKGLREQQIRYKGTVKQKIQPAIAQEKQIEQFARQERPVTQKTKAMESILAKEKEIFANPIENGLAIDVNGKIVLQKTGSTNEIILTAKERAELSGTIFTHNHPQSASLSTADASTMIATDMNEIRAVSKGQFQDAGKRVVYSLRATDRAITQKKTLFGMSPSERISYEARDISESHLRETLLKIESGKTTAAEAMYNHWHEVWQKFMYRSELAKGLEYRKEVFDD